MAATRTGHIVVLGIGVALALGLASACRNTAEGVKEDSRENTEKAREGAQAVKQESAEATKTVGAAAKDLGSAIKQESKDVGSAIAGGAKDVASDVAARTQTLEVKTALLAAKGIDASHIDVNTDAGTKTVTLNGSVPTSDQKTAAERVARDKAKGYTVRNLLTVAGR